MALCLLKYIRALLTRKYSPSGGLMGIVEEEANI
jgi:hypothetical protein